MVNDDKNRVVTVSYDDERINFRSRLFDTASGILLWEKQGVTEGVHPTRQSHIQRSREILAGVL